MDNVYRKEYTREQARLDARRDAQPSTQKKRRILPYAAPSMFIGLLVYTLYNLGKSIGFSPHAFLELDFIAAVLALTILFLWARLS